MYFYTELDLSSDLPGFKLKLRKYLFILFKKNIVATYTMLNKIYEIKIFKFEYC
jgi:hypothetical protein